jgi:hypothetical protein
MILPLLLTAVAALQAPQEDERTKRILDRIEKEIRASEERLREEIRAILRTELGGAAPAPAPKPPPPPPPPPAAKRKVLLGITADEMTDAERKKLGLGGGIKIAEVRGPAAQAGLRSGDILVSADGKPVTEETIGALLEKKQPGDELAVEVVRGSERVKLTVVLGERKE